MVQKKNEEVLETDYTVLIKYDLLEYRKKAYAFLLTSRQGIGNG